MITRGDNGHSRRSRLSVVHAKDTTMVEVPSRIRGGWVSSAVVSSLSMLSIIAMDTGVREVFRRLEWRFPPSVAGMVFLFTGLVGLDRCIPSNAERVARALEPGSAQFLAWLPVLFVPALIPWIRSPLAILASWSSPSHAAVTAATVAAKTTAARASSHYSFSPSREVRSAAVRAASAGTWASKFREAANITRLLLTAAGFCLAHLGSASAVVRAFSPASSRTSPTESAATASSSKQITSVADVSSPRVIRWLGFTLMASGATTLASFVFLLGESSWICRVAMSVWAMLGIILSMGLATPFGFAIGHASMSSDDARSPTLLSPWIRAFTPLVLSAAMTVGTGETLGWITGLGLPCTRTLYVSGDEEFDDIVGGGDVLLRLLGPAVFSFAVPLFRMRRFVFGNAIRVVGSSFCVAWSALFGAALTSRLLGLPAAFRMASQTTPQRKASTLISKLGQVGRLCFFGYAPEKRLPPKMTSFASALGTYASPVIAGILVLSGVLGVTVGPRVLDSLGLKDPTSIGLIQGSTTHLFGVTASPRQESKRNGAASSTTSADPSVRDIAAVAMILTCVAGTVLVNIPVVRPALLSLAMGSTAGMDVPFSESEYKRWQRTADRIVRN